MSSVSMDPRWIEPMLPTLAEKPPAEQDVERLGEPQRGGRKQGARF